MDIQEETAQGIIDGIRDLFGLDGDTDILSVIRQCREDERSAHADWRRAADEADALRAALREAIDAWAIHLTNLRAPATEGQRRAVEHVEAIIRRGRLALSMRATEGRERKDGREPHV